MMGLIKGDARNLDYWLLGKPPISSGHLLNGFH